MSPFVERVLVLEVRLLVDVDTGEDDEQVGGTTQQDVERALRAANIFADVTDAGWEEP